MPSRFLFEDDIDFDDYDIYEEDEELEEETHYDLNEDMEKYYDFNLLDLLEDTKTDLDGMSISEGKKYLGDK